MPTYRSPEYFFSVQYPEGWRIQDPTPEPFGMMWKFDGDFRLTLIVGDIAGPGQSAPLRGRKKLLQALARRTVESENGTLVKEDFGQASGLSSNEAFIYSFLRIDENGHYLKKSSIQTRRKEYVFTANLSHSEKPRETNEATFDKIVHGLTIEVETTDTHATVTAEHRVAIFALFVGVSTGFVTYLFLGWGWYWCAAVGFLAASLVDWWLFLKPRSTYEKQGIASLKKDDHDGAIAALTRLLEIDPQNATARANRGIARQRKGDHDRAIADFTRALEINPKRASVFYMRGRARREKGDLDGAIGDYTRAIEINPEDAGAYYHRGDARRTRGDLSGAVADYKKALGFTPPNLPERTHVEAALRKLESQKGRH